MIKHFNPYLDEPYEYPFLAHHLKIFLISKSNWSESANPNVKAHEVRNKTI